MMLVYFNLGKKSKVDYTQWSALKEQHSQVQYPQGDTETNLVLRVGRILMTVKAHGEFR